MSAVADLNDNCFSLATGFVADLCREFEEEIGEKPTIDETYVKRLLSRPVDRGKAASKVRRSKR
jgi:hypothetical protein